MDRFEIHLYKSAIGVTKEVQQDEAIIDSDQIYGTRVESRFDKLDFQVFDQPGSNSYDFSQKNYCESLLLKLD